MIGGQPAGRRRAAGAAVLADRQAGVLDRRPDRVELGSKKKVPPGYSAGIMIPASPCSFAQ